LPRFVNVADPLASPLIVKVGSAVAVVEILILPDPSKLALPVTAPVRAILRGVANADAVSAFPVNGPLKELLVKVVPSNVKLLLPSSSPLLLY
jgi:hypothetical protein